MDDENKITEELQLHIQYLEQTLEDTKNKLEKVNEENYKIHTEYNKFRIECSECKNSKKVTANALFSLFILSGACIGIITAYGYDPDVFFRAFYLTSLGSIFDMLLKCISSIFMSYLSILFCVFMLIIIAFEYKYERIFGKPIVHFLICFVLGIFIASVIIKKFFWFVGA